MRRPCVFLLCVLHLSFKRGIPEMVRLLLTIKCLLHLCLVSLGLFAKLQLGVFWPRRCRHWSRNENGFEHENSFFNKPAFIGSITCHLFEHFLGHYFSFDCFLERYFLVFTGLGIVHFLAYFVSGCCILLPAVRGLYTTNLMAKLGRFPCLLLRS
jgi:hypothetical protein